MKYWRVALAFAALISVNAEANMFSLFHQLLKSVQNSHSVKMSRLSLMAVVATQLVAVLMGPITPTMGRIAPPTRVMQNAWNRFLALTIRDVCLLH